MILGRTVCAVILLVTLLSCSADTDTPPRLILDTDISSDADDVGAVALLHHAADQRQVDILAMMVSSGDPWSGGCLQVLNSYFNRPAIPLGLVSGKGIVHESAYTKTIAEMGDHQQGRKEDAVTLYREILAQQPDHSVTVVTIGYLTNLKGLLASTADEHSELTGRELVRQKVDRLVCMGGEYPQGKEWNFYQDAAATNEVLNRWPTAIVFVGFELGKDVITGSSLRETPDDNPVRVSYELHNDLKGRPSWDQLAVLYAILGEKGRKKYFRLSKPGVNMINDDGTNHWQEQPQGKHFYLTSSWPAKDLSEAIDNMMVGGGRMRTKSEQATYK